MKDTYKLHDVEGEMRAAKLWCKNVSACKRKTAKGMARFLSGWVSRSEATGHVTVDPEKSPSEINYERNLRDKIERWESVIKEWSDERLRESKSFLSAYGAYPEFRAWVKEQRLGLKIAVESKVKPVIKPEILPQTQNPTSDADLPPPPTKKDRFISRYRAVKQAKENGTVENIVRNESLF